MVNLSGFRPPQFSEEVTWLPAWLQPCESSEDYKEGYSQFKPTFEELSYQNIATREDANLLFSEEGRYKSCHLFLSAEDNSPLTYASSSGNVPNFHLHLSLDNFSVNTQSQLLEISQAEICESDHATPLLCSGTSLFPGEKANQYKCEVPQYAGSTNLPTSLLEKSDNLGPQCTSNNLDNSPKHDNRVKILEDVDITAAVELSIAASEALSIHEIIDSGHTTNTLSASAILEVALRVKQARVEGYGEASDIMHEETSDIDYLSDLDDYTMNDAYEEVGLTLCDLHLPSSELNISQVKDTYSLENYEGDEKLNPEEPDRLGVNSADISTKQHPEDVTCFGIQLKGNDALEPFENVKQKNFIDDLSPELEASDIAFDMNVLETPEVASTTKKVGFAMEDITSLQVKGKTSHRAMIPERNERNGLTDKAQEKFQSRWFGGWTQKNEVDTFATMEHKNARSIPKYVISETSILSESADMVPDENSFVQKQYKVSSLASQSSIPSKRLSNESIEIAYFDEDIMNLSTPSMVDPLCSVVPCSISIENACSNLAQNHEGRAETSKCFIPIQEHNGNKLERFSSDYNIIRGQEPTVQVTDSVVSQPIAHRKVTSLRTYSMLLPSSGAYLDNGNCDQSFPLQCNFNKSYSFFQSSMANTIDGTRNSDESAKGTSVLVLHKQKETGSPVNINCGSKSFHASKSSLLDIDGEEDPEQAAFRNKDDELLQINNLRIAKAHNGRVPGRKRVRFAEAHSSFPQKRKTQMDTTYSNRSTKRNVGLISSNRNLESEFKDMKRRASKTLDKNLKRHVFQNIKFLLTGFSSMKEKEIEGLIRKYGGIVLSDIPSPPTSRALRSSRFRRQLLPVILCSRKLQTVKFLYGCAIKACLVTVDWLKDSIYAGSVLPTKKYMILPNLCGEKFSGIGKPTLCDKYIFDRVGIMLHGKPNFCNKIAKVIKHGGGLIFKTLHMLVQGLDDKKISVGAIVTEDESGLSRHLKHCALEWKIPLMPDTWIIKSLYAGKLLPFIKNNRLGTLCPSRLLDIPVSQELSQEI